MWTPKVYCSDPQWRVWIYLAVAVGGVLGSCRRYLDPIEVETLITTEFPQRIGLTVGSVDCPEKEPLAANADFPCQVVLEDGQSLDVRVTQQDDQGAVVWDVQEGLQQLEGVIDNDRLAQEITAGIFAQTQIQVETDCGAGLRLAKQGEAFTCTTTDTRDQIREIQVTVEDNAGRVSWGL